MEVSAAFWSQRHPKWRPSGRGLCTRSRCAVAHAPFVGTAQDQLAPQALHWLKGGAHPTPAVYLSRHAKDAGHLPDMFERWSIPSRPRVGPKSEPSKARFEGPFDWVFFSSRNVVDAFLPSMHFYRGKKWGPLVGTARKLERHCTLDFVEKAPKPKPRTTLLPMWETQACCLPWASFATYSASCFACRASHRADGHETAHTPTRRNA